MWWRAKEGLSAKAAGQASAEQVNHPSNPSSYAENSQPIDQLGQMMQQIGDDIAGMVDGEKNQLMSEVGERARSWCMQDISHDLRTPLNAIIGFAQMMENGALGQIENPQYIEYLRHIRESGYDLLGKVETLMETPSTPTPQAGQSPARSALSLEEAIA